MSPVLILFLGITAASGAGTEPPCPESWALAGSYCFWASAFVVRWHEVEAVCELASPFSRPASIHSQVENSVLDSLLNGQPGWLGLHRYGSVFNWSDGTGVDFSYWDRRQPHPGGQCALINSNNVTGQWATADCDGENMVTCRQKAALCPDGWTVFDRKCYRLGSQQVTFSQVAAQCDSLHTGATPVSIHSDELNVFLASQASSSTAWIGLSRASSIDSFLWADGLKVDFQRWSSSQPSSNYNTAYMNSNGYWYTGSSARTFFCEFSI